MGGHIMINDLFRPTYDLEKFKSSEFSITSTALKGAAALGLDTKGIKSVIKTMQPKHFYKSMTSLANHKVWQDVYHVPYNNTTLYIKFTEGILTEFILLSFKEK